jgi:hypothetical protein
VNLKAGCSFAHVESEAGAVGHLIDSRIARHHECIGKVKVVEAGAQVKSVGQAELNADGLLKREVHIGAVLREGFLVEADQSALDGVVGLPYLAISPQQAHADGRDAESIEVFIGRALRISPNVGFAGLAQDRNWQHFRHVVPTGADERAPGVAIILDSRDVEIAPPTVGKDVVVPEGVEVLKFNSPSTGLLGWLVCVTVDESARGIQTSPVEMLPKFWGRPGTR